MPRCSRNIGDDQVVYAPGFPHRDHGSPKSVAELEGRPDLTHAQKRKGLAATARRGYRRA